MKYYTKIQPWVIWFLAAAFFFCEYFARVDAGVMLDQLMQTFHASATAIGYLGAFFYYPYIVMQIPVGLLVDKYGPRRWLAAAALVSAVGSAFFAFAYVISIAELGRFMVGLGSAFAFVSAVKLATIWFDNKRLGLLVGLTQGAGMLGAAFGTGVFSLLVMHWGWRGAMNSVALVLFVFALLIYWLVKDKRDDSKHSSYAVDNIKHSIGYHLQLVLSSKQSWFNALYAGFLYAPTAALGEFWGVSFFHHMYSFSIQQSGLLMGAIFIGWAVGGPCMGWLSDRIMCRKPLMLLSVLSSLMLLSLLFFGSHWSYHALLCLMFFYGVSNTGVALAYAVAGELHGPSVVGMSVAFTNMASILIGALLQPVIGLLLDHEWVGRMQHGIRMYPPAAYHDVLFILPCCLVISCIFAIFVRESYPVTK